MEILTSLIASTPGGLATIIFVTTLLVLPYLTFVFFGECLNPLLKPKYPLLPGRWRYGRHMALLMMLSMLISNTLIFLLKEDAVFAFLIGGLVFLLLGLYLHLKWVASTDTLV